MPSFVPVVSHVQLLRGFEKLSRGLQKPLSGFGEAAEGFSKAVKGSEKLPWGSEKLPWGSEKRIPGFNSDRLQNLGNCVSEPHDSFTKPR